MTRSIRARLLVGTIAGSSLVLLATGVLLYRSVRIAMRAEFDRMLAARARTLASLVEGEGSEFEVEIDYRLLPEFGENAARPEYFQIRRGDGQTIERSLSLGDGDLPQADRTAEGYGACSAALPDGRPGRVVTVSASARTEKRSRHPSAAITVTVAAETAELERNLARLRHLLAGLGLLAITLAAATLYGVVRRGLRQLDDLATKIAAIDPNRLPERLDMPHVPQELGAVVTRTNELLARLDRVLRRERSFSADVAHELRTPLAGLRSTIELAKARPREAAEYRAALQECLSITTRMQSMVESLLSLARAESGAEAALLRPVRIWPLLSECWSALADRAARKRVEVIWPGRPEAVAVSDPEKLAQVFRNVLENAVSYVDEGGRIELRVTPNRERVEIEIANSGSHLTSEEVSHVFDRFWRGSKAREQTGEHFGLGLCLVQRLVALLGGSAAVRHDPAGRFVLTIRLPTDPAAAENDTESPSATGTPAA